ncbi:MAG: hypothetical protein RL660_1685 [Bacteroidota bacterium]|jgi:hypothetical protein
MPSECALSCKLVEKLHIIFEKSTIKKHSKAFNRRSDALLNFYDLFLSFCYCLSLNELSYNKWANGIELLSNIKVRKQAIFSRMNSNTVKMLEELLSILLAKQVVQ